MPNSTLPNTSPSEVLPPRVAAFLNAYDAASLGAAPAAAIDLSPTIERMHAADTPFPHGRIDRFLPAELYDALLAAWPDATHLAPVSLPGADYVGARTTLLVDAHPASDDMSEQVDAAVAQLATALRAPRFVRALFTRFATVIDANLQGLAINPDDAPGFRLYLCRDAGEHDALGAHLDALRKLLTIVVYMDLRGALTAESDEAWGTTLYPAHGETITPVTFTPNADHTAAAHIPFAPNRAFIMPNTSASLHGVAGGQPEVSRRTVMCGYWLFDAL
jgi:hypothetical protein